MTQHAGAVVTAIADRQREIVVRLQSLDEDELRGDSLLPGWDRLTIACHLRYGAIASRRMITESLAARPVAFYPEGRERQRPATLKPADGESPRDVIDSLDRESRRLEATCNDLDDATWRHQAIEPPDKPDLGPITLSTVAMLRLTEVEVHGYDLDLGLLPWSETFVDAALPMRLQWLPSRRSNNRAVDHAIDGTWALAVKDGPTYLVRARGNEVEVQVLNPEAGLAAGAEAEIAGSKNSAAADTTIMGPADRLLAFILGRRPLESLTIAGDTTLAASFLAAFPAP